MKNKAQSNTQGQRSKVKGQWSQKGFTLIELLIVIALIAIIAAVAFVALDPLTRFRDARDSARWGDIAALATAIQVDQIDNGGNYIAAITSTTQGVEYMIGTGTSGCDDATDDSQCDTSIDGDTDCVDLTGLATEGYISSIPVSPNGAATWSSSLTGYTLTRNTSTLVIAACESENSTSISIER